MKTIVVAALALLVSACVGSDYTPPSSSTDAAPGPCQNVNCVKHPADKDPR